MLCDRCHQNPVVVHVVEIAPDAVLGVHGGPVGVTEEHLCAVCAQEAKLPFATPLKKTPAEIWQLLQKSSKRARATAGLACPECQLTLTEFRQRGRLGCSACYETFGPHLGELLERIHGSTEHVGRLPGLKDEDLDRMQRVTELERALESAIREEAYENAARIRDELNGLKGGT